MANGKIYPKGTAFLRQHVGEAESDHLHFEMSLVNMTTPAVYCHETGKYFVLPWQDILNMAEEAGVGEQ
jgi:hypothetical protein